MTNEKIYQEFPWYLVLGVSLVGLMIYILGAIILAGFGFVWIVPYLIFGFWVEWRVLKIGCPHCYYYNKLCCFGKGKVSAWLFKKGDPQKFVTDSFSWLDLVPDFLVSLIPIIGGIILLFIDFSVVRFVLLLLLAILAFGVTGFIRSQIACKFCQQRLIGCPAEQLFSGANK